MARKSLLEQLGASAQDIPDEPLDAVPEILARRPKPARPEPKRNRDWETRQRREGVVTYRGVPPELRDQIAAIAQAHGVRAGDVARMFLEHGLAAYRRRPFDPAPQTSARSVDPVPGRSAEIGLILFVAISPC